MYTHLAQDAAALAAASVRTTGAQFAIVVTIHNLVSRPSPTRVLGSLLRVAGLVSLQFVVLKIIVVATQGCRP